MTHSPYLLFHQTPEQLRRIGARGGKAQARNRREGLRGQRPTQSDIIAHLPRPSTRMLRRPDRTIRSSA